MWSRVQVVGRTRPAAGNTHPSQSNGTLEVIICAEPPEGDTSAAAAVSGGGTTVNVADSVQAHMIRAGTARLLANSSLRGPAARSAAQVRVPIYNMICWLCLVYLLGLPRHANLHMHDNSFAPLVACFCVATSLYLSQCACTAPRDLCKYSKAHKAGETSYKRVCCN